MLYRDRPTTGTSEPELDTAILPNTMKDSSMKISEPNVSAVEKDALGALQNTDQPYNGGEALKGNLPQEQLRIE